MAEDTGEYARLNMGFVESLRLNAVGLSSRVGSLAISAESEDSLYPPGAYEMMVTMYINLKAMLLLLDTAIQNGKVEDESLLIEPAMFIKITECSQMSIAVYDELNAAYNINFTVH